MKKIYKKLTMVMAAVWMTANLFAATEQAWYNDVTSITANGQYYIYSVNGKGFMQGGNSKVKALTQNNYNSESGLLFTINTSDKRTYTGSNYLCSYETRTCGPVGATNTNGSSIIWENKSSYWLVYGSYTFTWAQKAYLRYENNAYAATCLNPDLTDAKFQWFLISPAQYDRHWAIYFFDKKKEECADYAKYENLVPTAYYSRLNELCNTSFDVKNTALTKEGVLAVRDELKNLYEGAETIAEAYTTAQTKIADLEAIEDKGEDITEVTADIDAAREAIEKAMTVEAVNASVANLKAIDPITFNETTFTALQELGSPAATAAGRTITYKATDNNIINAAGLPVYKGTTTLVATAAATANYYKFVRSAQVTVEPIHNTGEYNTTVCRGSSVEYHGETFTEAITKDFTLENRTGGDSIVTLTVIVLEPSAYAEEKTITYGDAEEWHGYDLSERTVGTHELTYTTVNAAGCDSVVTLTLTVNKQATLEVPVSLSFCAGGSATYRGADYMEEGTYPVSVEGVTRDTVYTVTVTVLEPSAYAEEKTITYGDAEEWHGYDLSERTVGTHELTYTTVNAAGCDSVVTLTLTVNKQATLEVPVSLSFCAGGSAEYRGADYTEAGTHLVEAAGATRDTVYTVTVTVLEPSAYAEEKTITYGDAEEWHGYDLSERTVGTHELTYTTTNAAGCDSVVTLTLTVNKQETLEVPVALSFCAGGSATYRGVDYTEAGTYPVSAEGVTRDTVYTVTVTVLEPSAYAEEKVITYGDAEEWHGYDLSERTVGTHELTYTTTNAAGCDSVVTLTLTVNKQETLELNQVLGFCAGDSAEFGGKWYSEAGNDTLTVEGATRDTLIYVEVKVYAPEYAEMYDTLTVGETLLLPDGEWFLGDSLLTEQYVAQEADTLGLVFVQTGKTANECESVTTLYVAVEPKAEEPEEPEEPVVTGWENIAPEQTAVKELRDGLLYIRREGKTYTPSGLLVK